jgi:hypothetical protein
VKLTADGNKLLRTELFPNISIGDAPLRAAKAATANPAPAPGTATTKGAS